MYRINSKQSAGDIQYHKKDSFAMFPLIYYFGNCGIGRLNHVQVPSPEAT